MKKERNNEDVWAEIELLRKDIKQLEVRREALIKHHAQLRVMQEQLIAHSEKAREMAEEVTEFLEGDEE